MLSRRTFLLIGTIISICGVWPGTSSAAPGPARIVHAKGSIVPIPVSVPHEEGDMVDSRIVPDLVWIAQHFPIYVIDGYSGPLPDGEHVGCHSCHVKHSDHYNGLAVDLVPLNGDGKCDVTWSGISRLARWAEPQQNQPVPPFRWVGYEGDAGHGCGNHLHLSWEHAIAPQFQLAEWVEVFPVGPQGGASDARHGKRKPAPAPKPAPTPKAPTGPPGGISTVHSGGVSASGD